MHFFGAPCFAIHNPVLRIISKFRVCVRHYPTHLTTDIFFKYLFLIEKIFILKNPNRRKL